MDIVAALSKTANYTPKVTNCTKLTFLSNLFWYDGTEETSNGGDQL